MFDRFGEFDSWEELNKAAEGQKDERDLEALKELAKENGIDVEDAIDYFNGNLGSLCTPITAALGKLDVEEVKLDIKEVMVDWMDYIRNLVNQGYDTHDYEMSEAVRKKGKRVAECFGKLLEYSYKHSFDVDPEIVKTANIGSGVRNVKLGMPGSSRAKKIIKEYYLGGDK